MAANPIAFATIDEAVGQLQSGINASVTSIPLQSGNGANFPQPYSSTTTSGGTSTALNCTGISATIGGSGQVGKLIMNLTDGSIAVITAVATDALTTSRLLGGSDNTWQNGDRWAIDAFVATFAIVSTSAYGVQSITQSEEALIIGRSTDTLTVATGGRGYNSTTAAAFSASDYVYLFVTSPIVERFKDVVSVVAQQVDTTITNLATTDSTIDNIESNTTFYVAAAGSSSNYTGTLSAMPAAYTTGERLYFKANHTNSGSATFNRASLGAKTIKKLDGATNLAAGDIQNGQIVEIIYDGTNYIMVSPLGQASSVMTNIGAVTAASSGVGSSSTAENTMSPTWTGSRDVGSSKIAAAGASLRIHLAGDFRMDSGDLAIRVKVGSTQIAYFVTSTANNASAPWVIDLVLNARSVGGSGSLMARGLGTFGNAAADDVSWVGTADAASTPQGAVTVDTTATQNLTVTAQFSASDADHTCTIQTGLITLLNTP